MLVIKYFQFTYLKSDNIPSYHDDDKIKCTGVLSSNLAILFKSPVTGKPTQGRQLQKSSSQSLINYILYIYTHTHTSYLSVCLEIIKKKVYAEKLQYPNASYVTIIMGCKNFHKSHSKGDNQLLNTKKIKISTEEVRR